MCISYTKYRKSMHNISSLAEMPLGKAHNPKFKSPAGRCPQRYIQHLSKHFLSKVLRA